MRNVRRCFAVKLLQGGQLQLIGFLSQDERKAYCEIKENHTRPITMAEWHKVPKNMKA